MLWQLFYPDAQLCYFVVISSLGNYTIPRRGFVIMAVRKKSMNGLRQEFVR